MLSVLTQHRRRAGRSWLALAVLIIGSACTSNNDHVVDDPHPISDYLGIAYPADLTFDEEVELQKELLRQSEVVVALCMAAAGFEYSPNPPPAPLSNGEGPRQGTRDWVEIYGFGITTQLFDQSVVGEGLLGTSFPSDPGSDSNSERLATMSDVERQAYMVALEGDLTMAPAADDVAITFTGLGGCRGEALAATGMDLTNRFETQMAAIAQGIMADGEMQSLRDGVRECVLGQGHQFRGLPVGYEQSIPPYSNEIQKILEIQAEGSAGGESASPAPLTFEAREMLRELQALERREALAAHDCGAEKLGSVISDLGPKYERSFISDNRSALEEHREFVTQLRSKYDLP